MRDGRFFRRDGAGRERPVLRIYNRVIADELERKGIELPFDPRAEIDVEWSPHPDWFWIWSKHSLPYLDHPAVPKTTLLSDLDGVPELVERDFVLKPLFSFAGGGVNVKADGGRRRRDPGGRARGVVPAGAHRVRRRARGARRRR